MPMYLLCAGEMTSHFCRYSYRIVLYLRVNISLIFEVCITISI